MTFEPIEISRAYEAVLQNTSERYDYEIDRDVKSLGVSVFFSRRPRSCRIQCFNIYRANCSRDHSP